MQQLLIQQQLSRRSPATVDPLHRAIPMQSQFGHYAVENESRLDNASGSGATGNVGGGEGHNLIRTQQQLNAALFNTDDSDSLLMHGGSKYAMNSNSGIVGGAAANGGGSNRNSIGLMDNLDEAHYRELHMAEQLVANADKQQKSAFQFDTIEPKNRRKAAAVTASLMQDSGIGE